METDGILWPIVATVAANMWSMPLLGVPLTVVGMSVLGATMGAGYGTPIKDRRELFVAIATHALLASALVAVVPAALGWDWVDARLEAPLAWGVAFATRFVLPTIPWKEIVRKVFRLDNKSEVDDAG